MSLKSFLHILVQNIASRTFESFLNKIDITMPADSITINELKEAFFFPLKTNKGPGYDEISSNLS